MKNVLIAFCLALLFLGLFIYLSNILAPWNEVALDRAIEQYDIDSGEDFDIFIKETLSLGLILNLLDLKNVSVWLIVLGVTFVSGFVGIHLMLDKLFFRRFFETPKLHMAIRRGVIIYLAVLGLIILRLISGFFWYNTLSVIFLAIAVELILHHYLDGDSIPTASNSEHHV